MVERDRGGLPPRRGYWAGSLLRTAVTIVAAITLVALLFLLVHLLVTGSLPVL